MQLIIPVDTYIPISANMFIVTFLELPLSWWTLSWVLSKGHIWHWGDLNWLKKKNHFRNYIKIMWQTYRLTPICSWEDIIYTNQKQPSGLNKLRPQDLICFQKSTDMTPFLNSVPTLYYAPSFLGLARWFHTPIGKHNDILSNNSRAERILNGEHLP